MANSNDSLTASLTGHTIREDLVNEPQTVTITLAGNTTGDSVIVEVDGEQTAPVAYNGTATDVANAVNALQDIEGVTATGGPLNTSPVVLHVPEQADIEDVPTWTLDTTDLTGTGTVAVTGGSVQATHDTTVVTDPNSQDAVQTPIAQQTNGLAAQAGQSPADALSL
jgi:hypothetical protein